MALNKQTELDDLATQREITNMSPELEDVRSAGERNSLISDIGFGVGAAGAGAAVYWLFTEGKGTLRR